MKEVSVLIGPLYVFCLGHGIRSCVAFSPSVRILTQCLPLFPFQVCPCPVNSLLPSFLFELPVSVETRIVFP